MKKIYITGALIFIFSVLLEAQIENVIVETYYISEKNDSSDILGGSLETGSTTYRVYLDLEEGYALNALIGDTIRPFIISSSELFFNSPAGADVPYNFATDFYPIGNYPLDSWLTLGYSTENQIGITKETDTDGSFIAGENNLQGMLANDDDAAGIPLTTADGLTKADTTSDFCEIVNYVNDSTFGSITKSKDFIFSPSSEFVNIITAGNPIIGATEENQVLVAQLTTKGELNFTINCDIISLNDSVAIGGGYNKVVYSYYGTDTLMPDNTSDHIHEYNNLLKYPLKRGCKDPWFLEYDPEAAIDDGSCRDSIVLGCMDIMACNYDENANFNVQEICCYGPDSCDNRDISVVCPNYESDGIMLLSLHPNPTSDKLNYQLEFTKPSAKTRVSIYNSYGKLVVEDKLGDVGFRYDGQINVSGLSRGVYVIKIGNEKAVITGRFLKP